MLNQKKINEMKETYEPKPMDLSSIEIPEELKPLKEKLAEKCPR